MQVLFEIMVQIKQKRGIGVENPSPRSFSGGLSKSIVHLQRWKTLWFTLYRWVSCKSILVQECRSPMKVTVITSLWNTLCLSKSVVHLQRWNTLCFTLYRWFFCKSLLVQECRSPIKYDRYKDVLMFLHWKIIGLFCKRASRINESLVTGVKMSSYFFDRRQCCLLKNPNGS